ncbi:MAG: outer membrane beta-barrel protein [bacterium]
MKTIRFLLITLLLSLLLSAATQAKEEEKVTFSVGLLGTYNSIGSDFNGTTSYVSSDNGTTVYVPKVSAGSGLGLISLIKIPTLPYDCGISYLTSSHSATWNAGAASGNVTYSLFNIDFYIPFMTQEKLAPYYVLGMSMCGLTVPNGSENNSAQTGDATFTGAGLNLGLGTEYFLLPKLALRGETNFRFTMFSGVSGVGGVQGRITNIPTSSALDFSFGATYYL